MLRPFGRSIFNTYYSISNNVRMTSPAQIMPATGGTKDMLPGVCFLFDGSGVGGLGSALE